MVPYYGDFLEDDTVLIPFNTFDSNDPSGSVTMTGVIDGDIKVYKDGGTTAISTDGATITVNFSSLTGMHLLTIDTSVHSDYAVGSEYMVAITTAVIDVGTVDAFIGSFSIQRAGGALAKLLLIEAAVITNAAGADVAADIIAIKTETAAILDDTDLIDDGTSGLAKIATDVANTLVDTAVIGALGIGLTAIPWNTAWDAEVQSECADALVAYDPPTRTEATSDKAEIVTDLDDIKGTGFVKDTHSLFDIEGYVDLIDDGTSGLAALKTLIDLIPTTAMRGTDSAATASNLATVDTVVAAIKVITDQMAFTKSNELNVNTLSINGAGLVGDGDATPWDGA